ncbi:MAG: hypothetical protein IPN38_06675 [Flavobacteriales bacterium]|nr:hypothetical protein [Flavobacteriales bacterium]
MVLLALLLIPFLTALALMATRPTNAARGIALLSTLASLGTVLWLCLTAVPGSTVLPVQIDWVPSLGLRFVLGYDGISLLMLLLTAVVFPFIIGAGYTQKLQHPSMVNALLLFTQSFLFGVFTAQNAFLFYIFYELSLVPVFFLLLYWGGERRRAITVRFFIYTLLGGLMLLFGLAYCVMQTAPPSAPTSPCCKRCAFLRTRRSGCSGRSSWPSRSSCRSSPSTAGSRTHTPWPPCKAPWYLAA